MKTDTEFNQALYSRAFYVWHESFLKNSDASVNTSPQPLAFVCNVSIVDLSSSETFAGFITDQGYLYCWLWPEGISGRNEIKINPTAVTSVEEFASGLSCGYNHISCVTESGSLYIWMFGREEVRSGEFSLESLSSPIVLRDWEYPVKQIRSGSTHVLVLLSNNDLYCVRLPEQSESGQVRFSELAATKVVDISEPVTEMQAGAGVSAFLCGSNVYYQFLPGEGDAFGLSAEQCPVQRVGTEAILESHACQGEGCCGYRISTICLFKGFIAMGVAFECEVAQFQDLGTVGHFSRIFIYSVEEKTISAVKYSDGSNFFRSLHWLCDHLCAIFVDGTIWFRDRSAINEENSDIVIRPKGDTKLFFASASGRCLIINISQNLLDSSPLSGTASGESNGGNEAEAEAGTKAESALASVSLASACARETEATRKEMVEKMASESVVECGKVAGCPGTGSKGVGGKTEVPGESFLPSNTTFEASDQEGEGRRVQGFGLGEEERLPSYQRLTESSMTTRKPQRHSFLRKGEGKMRTGRSVGVGSERSDSKLSSSGIPSGSGGGACLVHPSRKKLQEYETRVYNLERENRRILEILHETKRRYLGDVKALYAQLKERSDERFPLKSVIEQLQKELFVEREERSKLREEYELVRSQLQSEICSKDIKRDLLNAQLVLERDRLSKEKEELERQRQELSSKGASLEILVAELSSKYSRLQQDHEGLVGRYEEIDQAHTLTVNQLSKSELELYELRKELELSKASKNTSVNELYEYIGELENSLRELKAAASEERPESSVGDGRSQPETRGAAAVEPEGDERAVRQVRNLLSEKLALLKAERWSELLLDSATGHSNKSSSPSRPPSSFSSESEACLLLVDDAFNIFAEKIGSFKRKVSLLEKCIKVRRDDINVLVESSQ